MAVGNSQSRGCYSGEAPAPGIPPSDPGYRVLSEGMTRSVTRIPSLRTDTQSAMYANEHQR
jgi:hypothetical protein